MLAWLLWHLPLFFIEGTFQAELGVATLSFWIFMLVIIPQTITMTWIYNSNNCMSTLSAVLFHFTGRFIGEIFDLSRGADLILLGMWIVLALLVIATHGPKRLSRKQDGKDSNGMIQEVQRDVTLPRAGTGEARHLRGGSPCWISAAFHV